MLKPLQVGQTLARRDARPDQNAHDHQQVRGSDDGDLDLDRLGDHHRYEIEDGCREEEASEQRIRTARSARG